MSKDHTLTERARRLVERAEDVKQAPVLSRPAEALALAEAMGALLLAMAERLDALTPFIDEAA